MMLLDVRNNFVKYDLKQIQTVGLTIGFPISGSSLIGFLLTAHPNIVFADEPEVIRNKYREIPYEVCQKRPSERYLYEADDLKAIFDYIIYTDQARWQQATRKKIKQLIPLIRNIQNNPKDRAHRYILLPHQQQGCFKSLKVIGVKRSKMNTHTLLKNNILETFRKKLTREKINLKFIFTVRNPYDIIASDISKSKKRIMLQRYSKNKTQQSIRKMFRISERSTELLKKISSEDIFILKHEDIVQSPKQNLTELCHFLQVPTSPNYLDDCTSKIFKNAHKSRYKIDWPQEQKQEIETLIKKYDFFSGYSWES